jgi:hypothetical protein
MKLSKAFRRDLKLAKLMWGDLEKPMIESLLGLLRREHLSVSAGDLLLIGGRWYVTHSGLLRLALRKACQGMRVQPAKDLCNREMSRFVFRATVFTSPDCKGFVGYGDADPSNVSPLVHGAEMRVAETRAVNRALRKAYGIGICSVEELGTLSESVPSSREARKLPPQPTNGNYGGPKVRDHLCQIIRRHQLDPTSVKAYAVEFCGTKTLREATREQVENFVQHLSEWAEKDRNALLCQLNSYPRIDNATTEKEGAA